MKNLDNKTLLTNACIYTPEVHWDIIIISGKIIVGTQNEYVLKHKINFVLLFLRF